MSLPLAQGHVVLEDLAVFHIVAVVELLAGALPAVVAPEPIGRVLADRVLQHQEIAIGQLVFLKLAGVEGDELELGLVVATARTADLEVEDGLVQFACDALRAREHGGYRGGGSRTNGGC